MISFMITAKLPLLSKTLFLLNNTKSHGNGTVTISIKVLQVQYYKSQAAYKKRIAENYNGLFW